MHMHIFFLTSNDAKFAEAQLVLPGIRRLRAEIPEMQHISVSKVAAGKAKAASEMSNGGIIFVEDTGLYVDAWNGFPGALSKWAYMSIGNREICRMLNGRSRKAYAETCVAFCIGGRVKAFSGRTYGRVAASPRGRNGFGFDSIFVPSGSRKTFAELDRYEKDRVSPRGIALRKASEYIRTLVSR